MKKFLIIEFLLLSLLFSLWKKKEEEIMSGRRKGVLVLCLIGVLLVISSFPKDTSGQTSFPARPITMIIESGAGGMADTMTRLLCKAAEKELGQPIVCENKPGGGMTIAKNYVVKSEPDGYTIGVSTTATNINIPHMRDLPYNVHTDQRDIATYFKYTHALCVKADAPWKTFEDVLAYAKQNPGKFTYATAGVGVTQHIVMERIAMKQGIKWSMVPFKSGSEAVVACLGGHTHAVAQGPADVIPHIEAGKLKLLLALNDNRWPISPNIPTVLEKYGFFGMNYQSIYGPRGIPDHAAEKLENAFKKAVSNPSFVEGAKTLQVVIFYMSGKDYDKFWRSHYDEMGKVVRDLGLGK